VVQEGYWALRIARQSVAKVERCENHERERRKPREEVGPEREIHIPHHHEQDTGRQLQE